MTARITDFRMADRPRERLFSLGPISLSDAELVAILLGSGRPGTNAVALAQSMLVRFGGLSGLLSQGSQDLERVDGVGPAMAARFLSAAELCRRSAMAGDSPFVVRSSADLAAVAVPQLANLQVERLLMFPLAANNTCNGGVFLAEGTANHAECAVHEVLQAVLNSGKRQFSLAHNHLSGRVEPSAADTKFTARVVVAARQCGLQLLDHVIVAGNKWKSII